MVKLRSEQELELMRESGRITAVALKKVLESVKVGVTGLELDQIAEEEMKSQGAQSSFKTVEGYRWTICVTVNEQVVHGIPTTSALKEGDIVSIDLGALYKGWHTDAAWSVLVTAGHPEQSEGSVANATSNKLRDPSSSTQDDKSRFLAVGEEALWLGIKQAVDGNKIGDISEAIQKKVEGFGYSIVRSLVGHGVGEELHEDPEVPGYGRAGTGMVLKSGMTIAIEVIYNMGKPEVLLDKDGWTIISADESLAGLFEMSIIVGKEKAQILTDWRN